MQMVLLHMFADAGSSAGVVFSSVMVRWKGWMIADPLIAMVISSLILYRSGIVSQHCSTFVFLTADAGIIATSSAVFPCRSCYSVVPMFKDTGKVLLQSTPTAIKPALDKCMREVTPDRSHRRRHTTPPCCTLHYTSMLGTELCSVYTHSFSFPLPVATFLGVHAEWCVGMPS
jgi:Co/Zn/Cd efflux system component